MDTSPGPDPGNVASTDWAAGGGPLYTVLMYSSIHCTETAPDERGFSDRISSGLPVQLSRAHPHSCGEKKD